MLTAVLNNLWNILTDLPFLHKACCEINFKNQYQYLIYFWTQVVISHYFEQSLSRDWMSIKCISKVTKYHTIMSMYSLICFLSKTSLTLQKITCSIPCNKTGIISFRSTISTCFIDCSSPNPLVKHLMIFTEVAFFI